MLKVPGYNPLRKLGQGSYGEVYLVKKRGSEQLVAVKCISKLKLSKRGEDNLVSEIAILQKLEHPHIVRLLDFTWDSTKVYLYMEYCAGGDLSQFIRAKHRLPENLVRRFLRQLGLALQYLKSKNIVHMDLKPQNILLTSNSHPILKVTDFGFARRAKDAVQRNELRGTLLYMAPEIYCEGLYHPSCDLWSVGVILYECLFGSPPYASQDSESLKLKLLKDEPIELPSDVAISPNCASLLRRLLKRHPTERMSHEEFFEHPFMDLEHAPTAESLDKALNHLEQAHELEKVCNWRSAYESYLRGLSHLVAAVEYELSPKPREELKQLTIQCFKQAEIVKARLKNERECDSRPVRPPASAKFVSPSATSVSETYFRPTTVESVARISTSRTAPSRPPLPPSLSSGRQSIVPFARNPRTKLPKSDVQSPEPSSSSLMGYFKSFFYSNSTSSVPPPQLRSQTSAPIVTPSVETNNHTGPRELSHLNPHLSAAKPSLDADVSSEKRPSTAHPFGSIASMSQDPLASNSTAGCVSSSVDSVPEEDSKSTSGSSSSNTQCLEESFQPLVPGKHIPSMSSVANQQPEFVSPCPNSHPRNEASKDVMPTLFSSAPGLSQLSSPSSVDSLPAGQRSADSTTATPLPISVDNSVRTRTSRSSTPPPRPHYPPSRLRGSVRPTSTQPTDLIHHSVLLCSNATMPPSTSIVKPETAVIQCSNEIAPALTGESVSYEALSTTVTNPDNTPTDLSSHPPSKCVDAQDAQPPIELTSTSGGQTSVHVSSNETSEASRMDRLRALSFCIGQPNPDEAPSDHRRTGQQTTYVQQMALLADTERLFKLRSMCDSSEKQYLDVLDNLEDFYSLLRTNQCEQALALIEEKFASCLYVTKADLNEKRRTYCPEGAQISVRFSRANQTGKE
ncbi:hypothetical protein AHF37_03102 [Paragonimus kellicotti]|nr:hypothetical protein AHF37_03102 [Paragonimus kellicotti]